MIIVQNNGLKSSSVIYWKATIVKGSIACCGHTSEVWGFQGGEDSTWNLLFCDAL